MPEVFDQSESQTLSSQSVRPTAQAANAGLYIVYNEVDENNLLFAPRENAQQFAVKYSRILNMFD